MVAVAADERAVGECPERSALVLSLLVSQELRVVDTSVIPLLMELADCKCTLRSICKRIVHKQKVIDAPDTLICEGTEAGLEH